MKAVHIKNISAIISGLRKHKKKIVFTNGCFDLLHRGHIEYLKKAKSLGDTLIIGLNSDSSVRKLKGRARPVNPLKDRIYMLSQYPFVDYIVPFSDETPLELIKKITPDILVKGGDYRPFDIVGRKFAGEVRIIKFVRGYSTTEMLCRMKNACAEK